MLIFSLTSFSSRDFLSQKLRTAMVRDNILMSGRFASKFS